MKVIHQYNGMTVHCSSYPFPVSVKHKQHDREKASCTTTVCHVNLSKNSILNRPENLRNIPQTSKASAKVRTFQLTTKLFKGKMQKQCKNFMFVDKTAI